MLEGNSLIDVPGLVYILFRRTNPNHKLSSTGNQNGPA